MKTKHYVYACFLLGAFSLSAQTLEIQEWSQAHPSVIFVESNDATTAYLENLEANNIQYIVYNEKIVSSDIAAFEAKNNPVPIKDSNEEAVLEIKTWMSKHRDVKIIKRSVYNQMELSKQAMYVEYGALILIGEEITIEDILNYE